MIPHDYRCVKLLFDENLSPKLIALLAHQFPHSNHIENLKMRRVIGIAAYP
jgi:predicted nuclease of predicted toxin-antitoxin system